MIDAALKADARRSGNPSVLRVGQRVQIRRTGEIGEVRSVDPATLRVLVAIDRSMRWTSRLRVDPTS